MSEGPVNPDRLDSWKEIATYINRSVRTVIRWEAKKGLPVHRIPGGERHSVFAYRHEIDAWMNLGDGALDPEIQPVSPAAAIDVSPAILCAAESESPDVARPDAVPPKTRFRAVWLAWAVIIFIGAAVSAYTILRIVSPRPLLLAGESQLTNDGALKAGLATDGANLYFGEWRSGRIVLSAVSVKGGPVREISTPFVQVEPLGVTGDGHTVLALVGEGQEEERQLWMVPIDGGAPRRLGNLLCHFASLSPDGRWIAFSLGNSIYLTADEGKTTQMLQAFAGMPQELRWSLDGQRILFRLWDRKTSTAALWELVLTANQKRTESLFAPVSPVTEPFASVSPIIDTADDAFVSTQGNRAGLFALESEWLAFRRRFVLTPLMTDLISTSNLAVDPRAHVLYFQQDLQGHYEIEWFDTQAHLFKPFLPGLSARDIDFSRDGRRIAYVRDPDSSLWVANSDGSSARKVDTADLVNIELPRWSPDGRQLAFMGIRPQMPYRIFVVAESGGAAREASQGTDNQGAPTWSADGRRLVYGRVWCQEEEDCSIQQIDLASSTQTMLPGSEGLSTARWSPDGRYVAALRSETHDVVLLDTRTHAWRRLAHGINGNDLSWSPDSQALYASIPTGDRPQVVHISLPNGKTEPAVDLSEFSKLSGRVDTWFAVTPDGSILFLRFVDGGEIYAVHYEQK